MLKVKCLVVAACAVLARCSDVFTTPPRSGFGNGVALSTGRSIDNVVGALESIIFRTPEPSPVGPPAPNRKHIKCLLEIQGEIDRIPGSQSAPSLSSLAFDNQFADEPSPVRPPRAVRSSSVTIKIASPDRRAKYLSRRHSTGSTPDPRRRGRFFINSPPKSESIPTVVEPTRRHRTRSYFLNVNEEFNSRTRVPSTQSANDAHDADIVNESCDGDADSPPSPPAPRRCPPRSHAIYATSKGSSGRSNSNEST